MNIGYVLIGIGLIIFLIYYCDMLIRIFKISRKQGWISFFLPPIILLFVLTDGDAMEESCIKAVIGGAIMMGGFYLAN